ncbi:PaaI family thioesterase [Pseudomonas mucidolens]|uniref:Acyl-CoA thioesterase n=1 Tax=Pseudomonas mucidolens TaxID=46679 RepID=A0A1H2NQ50_9PSED|nr:PaaI family thioesterase [Pseudomonas mucidolens]SDV07530.1 acyl-CoA thioesterase [Pseudomonas mucidolens]SQH31338.1 thioesterase family protein [Pseudomonas mucidolens]
MELPTGLTHSAFSELLGCRLQRLDQGVAEVALTLEPSLRNRAGKLHGGAIFSLVDIAMGLACSSSHGFDQQSATIECKINYIRAVEDGDVLCIARVIHPGRRTLVVEAEVHQGEKLVAKAQGTFAVL